MQALIDAAGREPLTGLHWILLTGEAEGALTLEQLRAKGRAALKKDPQAFEKIRAEVRAEDPAILYLTSGATGEPKMGLVTPRGADYATSTWARRCCRSRTDDSTIAFLPSAHIAQRVVIELLPIRMGIPVWFSESLAKLPHEMKTIRPTFLLAPPRVWERIFASINTEVKKKSAAARKMFHGAVGLGAEVSRLREEGKPVPKTMLALLKIADRLVFSKIRARLGGRIRVAASGAAPLGKDLARFYAAIGMPLIEGYGLTEGGVVCFNPTDRPKSGSIGVEAARRGAAAGRRWRAAGEESDAVLRILQRSGGYRSRVARWLALHRRHRRVRCRRIRLHHRPQERTDCFIQRQEDLSRADRAAVQDRADHQSGGVDRRSLALRHRSGHSECRAKWQPPRRRR